MKWGIGPLGECHLGPKKVEIQDFKPRKILGIEERKARARASILACLSDNEKLGELEKSGSLKKAQNNQYSLFCVTAERSLKAGFGGGFLLFFRDSEVLCASVHTIVHYYCSVSTRVDIKSISLSFSLHH